MNNRTMYDLQTQFATMNMYGDATMNYFALGGTQFVDPSLLLLRREGKQIPRKRLG